MPKLDCAVITPWVANPDPNTPGYVPQLTIDYAHQTQAAAALVDEVDDIVAAVATAEGHGQGFRTALNSMAEHGAVGYGIRLPVHIYDAIKATAHDLNMRPNPLFMGPVADPAEMDFEIYSLTLSVIQEGIRLAEDKTGQPAAAIIPAPNQYTVRAIMDETVLVNVMADNTYFYQTGVTIPDDPLNPGATPPSPHEKPPGAEMSQADMDAYRQWQESQGVPVATLAQLRDQAQRIGKAEQTRPTYGETTVETAAWQSMLTPGGTMQAPPDMTVAQTVFRHLRSIMPYLDLSPEFAALFDELREQERARQLQR